MDICLDFTLFVRFYWSTDNAVAFHTPFSFTTSCAVEENYLSLASVATVVLDFETFQFIAHGRTSICAILKLKYISSEVKQLYVTYYINCICSDARLAIQMPNLKEWTDVLPNRICSHLRISTCTANLVRSGHPDEKPVIYRGSNVAFAFWTDPNSFVHHLIIKILLLLLLLLL